MAFPAFPLALKSQRWSLYRQGGFWRYHSTDSASLFLCAIAVSPRFCSGLFLAILGLSDYFGSPTFKQEKLKHNSPRDLTSTSGCAASAAGASDRATWFGELKK